jgi:hypothetical protein
MIRRVQASAALAAAACAGVVLCGSAVAVAQRGAPPAAPPAQAPRGYDPTTYGGRNLPLPDFADNTGFVQIFDGKTLRNWDGDPTMWSVRDGAIYAESSESLPAGRTFIIWRGGEPANFDLKMESKWVGPGNGGIQTRSHWAPYVVETGRPAAPPSADSLFRAEREKWNVAGYQLNISNIDVGSMYEIATGRNFLTAMGRVNRIEEGKPPTTLAMLKTYDELFAKFHKDDWNQYEIIARGNTIAHIVNGELFSLTIDDDYGKRAMSGLIAIEIETRGTSKVWTKNIWLRNLP